MSLHAFRAFKNRLKLLHKRKICPRQKKLLYFYCGYSFICLPHATLTGSSLTGIEERFSSKMEIKTREVRDYIVVELHKNCFEKEYTNSLQTLIRDLVSNGAENIIIDFNKISNVNTAGLAELITIQKIALFNHINIKIYSLQPILANMFYQSGLNKFFDVCTHEEVQLIQDKLETTLIA